MPAQMNNVGDAEASMTVKVIKADGSVQQVESVELDTMLSEVDLDKINKLMNKHNKLKEEIKELENEIAHTLQGIN
jgi:uncharacterized tellurite resistance protein B-like protein